MNCWKIEANGLMTITQGETETDAILAYVQDAGYCSVADAAGVCGQTEAQFIADLHIRPVK
jgi:hypothetical protein